MTRGANAPRLNRVARIPMMRRDHFLHWFGLQAVVKPGKGKYIYKCQLGILIMPVIMLIIRVLFYTDNASHKAWDGDPKPFPEVDGIVRVAISTAPVGVAVEARLDSDKERDDGEVDEEDDAESDQ